MPRSHKFTEAGKLLVICTAILLAYFQGCGVFSEKRTVLTDVETVAGIDGAIGEPFGIAEREGSIFVSDGQHGKIWRITANGKVEAFAEGLDTPSGIALNGAGDLVAADSGSNTIRLISSAGAVSTIAGVEGISGFADGDALSAKFNAPIGVAADANGRIYIADTYNDRIRIIENGKVSTLAGAENGFADGIGVQAKFDTPTGLTIWRDKLLVADTGNRRIRVVEMDGRVWTLAGNDIDDLKDGLLAASGFVQPTSIAVNRFDEIFIADGNAIRMIGGLIPFVRTISNTERGVRDGLAMKSQFNRPSGMCIDANGELLISDSDNRLVRRFTTKQSGREITADEIALRRDNPIEFRNAAPARWPYDPPLAKRDIAGTIGEIRGEMQPGSDQIWFHNGLDIAGSYGETARFIRDEKVLRPIAAENFGTLRELIRMPTLGYIHIRLGRNSTDKTFGDPRFQFLRNNADALAGVRIPRGTRFKAGEPIGTLNSMNHVHLIAGRSGSEMNALDALTLPGLTDARPPVIEKVSLFDENWREIETVNGKARITLSGKTRIVVRAFDQVDGNADRRRLGVYRVGYEVYREDAAVTIGPAAEIRFDRPPPNEAVKFVYANGSKSGATGETIFGYIATNSVAGESFREGFIDPSIMEGGNYMIRVLVADFFGNVTSKDVLVEVNK